MVVQKNKFTVDMDKFHSFEYRDRSNSVHDTTCSLERDELTLSTIAEDSPDPSIHKQPGYLRRSYDTFKSGSLAKGRDSSGRYVNIV